MNRRFIASLGAVFFLAACSDSPADPGPAGEPTATLNHAGVVEPDGIPGFGVSARGMLNNVENESVLTLGGDMCVTLTFTASGHPVFYTEAGVKLTVTAEPSPHMHLHGVDVLGHSDSAEPFDIRRVDGKSMTAKSVVVTMPNPAADFLSSSGATMTLGTAGANTFPAGFENITHMTWRIPSGNSAIDDLEICPGTIVVDIDIKPGSDQNSIHPNSMGLVPVAILGSAIFDVTDVDVTTLAFGPAGAAPAHDLTDPATYADHLQDVNGDGFTDVVSHYRQKETGLTSGDTDATITGETTGGTPIEGTDAVNLLEG